MDSISDPDRISGSDSGSDPIGTPRTDGRTDEDGYTTQSGYGSYVTRVNQ